VICGTQAGSVSASKRAYYAGPGNKFWTTLHLLELTPFRFAPEAYLRLPDYGIGLTDVAKLTSGPDTALRKEHFDVSGFVGRIARFSPRIVAFNGKRAASVILKTRTRSLEYGGNQPRIGPSRVFVLPSTSGAASAYWDFEAWAESQVWCAS
jgi:double-stranded uracil-DNA glycosylase